jgi:hypothetical protein
MRIGMIGLGKMGANMTERLLKGGHEVVAYDLSADAVQAAAGKGAETSTSLAELAAKLTPPRAAWVMVPAGAHDRQDRRGAGRALLRRATSSSTGATPTTRSGWLWPGCSRVGRRLRRRRDLGRRVGPDRGLLPHGRRHQGGGGRRRAGPADPGARGRLRPRRAGRGGHFVKMVHNGSSTGSCRRTPRASRSWGRPTSSTSTCTRSRPSGATARWCAAGCWSWPSGRCGPAPGSTRSRAWWSTRARAAGRPRRPSTAVWRLR